jgi:hypothetical protein
MQDPIVAGMAGDAPLRSPPSGRPARLSMS